MADRTSVSPSAQSGFAKQFHEPIAFVREPVYLPFQHFDEFLCTHRECLSLVDGEHIGFLQRTVFPEARVARPGGFNETQERIDFCVDDMQIDFAKAIRLIGPDVSKMEVA